MDKVPRMLLCLAFTYFAFHFNSALCGFAAFVLFLDVA